MKRFFNALVVASFVVLPLAGCSEKSTATKQTTVETPGGTSETTTTVEVEKSGSNPPPAQQ